jgi:hypothetical protein
MVIFVKIRRISLCSWRQETFEKSHLDKNFRTFTKLLLLYIWKSQSTSTRTQASTVGNGSVMLP